jgi:hypothetical protein
MEDKKQTERVQQALINIRLKKERKKLIAEMKFKGIRVAPRITPPKLNMPKW